MVFIVISFSLLLSSGCSNKEGVPLLEQKCGTCHGADLVYNNRYDEEGWKKILHGMKIAGLKLSQQEEAEIMTLLLRDYSSH
ncbi:MAG: hypothetical protein JXQ81_04955 [Desulfuromonadales bacterium]|nr:hypothetical protein [Desulfuromonadales bacterium]MBN2791838.1 hypothetical protein [Desulfuromonadales bacterium]